MKHLTIWQLADFARGLGDDRMRSDIEAHVLGCSRCERVVRVLGAVAVTARAEAAFEPPDHVIRYARALYSLHKPEAVGLTRLIGRLVHDTGLAPVPVGMRAHARPTRHLLYEAGDYFLDVQVEQQSGSRVVNLVGQLAGKNTPQAVATANLPIWLTEGESLLASTVSNPLGEFQLECPQGRNVQLRVPLPAVGKRLDVSLRQVTETAGNGRKARRRPATRRRRP